MSVSLREAVNNVMRPREDRVEIKLLELPAKLPGDLTPREIDIRIEGNEFRALDLDRYPPAEAERLRNEENISWPKEAREENLAARTALLAMRDRVTACVAVEQDFQKRWAQAEAVGQARRKYLDALEMAAFPAVHALDTGVTNLDQLQQLRLDQLANERHAGQHRPALASQSRDLADKLAARIRELSLTTH